MKLILTEVKLINCGFNTKTKTLGVTKPEIHSRLCIVSLKDEGIYRLGSYSDGDIYCVKNGAVCLVDDSYVACDVFESKDYRFWVIAKDLTDKRIISIDFEWDRQQREAAIDLE